MPKIQKDKETKAVQEFEDIKTMAAIDPLSFIPNDAYTRKQTMLKDAMKSVRHRQKLIASGMPEDEAEEHLENIIKNASGFGVTRLDILRLDEQVVQELQEEVLNANPLLEKRQIRAEGGRVQKQEGGDLYEQMEGMMKNPTHTMPDGTEMAGATHGEYEEQMESLMDKETPMLPDEEMEEDYVNYVIEETLPSQDKDYLISALEKDDRLSEIFDQVVESATEFSGSGTIEGPGTETSDSIPARLSDGEFVFTAKAVEEIGVDTLTSMMKDAESEAEKRQKLNLGGTPTKEEEMTVDQYGKPIDSNIVDDEIRKGMLATNPRLK